MFKRILHSGWTTGLLGIVVCLLLFSVAGIVQPLSRADREMANLNRKLEEIAAQRSELERSRAFMQSDAYLERQARIKLQYKNPGEQVVFVYDAPNPSPASVSEQKSWWQRVRDYISRD